MSAITIIKQSYHHRAVAGWVRRVNHCMIHKTVFSSIMGYAYWCTACIRVRCSLSLAPWRYDRVSVGTHCIRYTTSICIPLQGQHGPGVRCRTEDCYTTRITRNMYEHFEALSTAELFPPSQSRKLEGHLHMIEANNAESLLYWCAACGCPWLTDFVSLPRRKYNGCCVTCSYRNS